MTIFNKMINCDPSLKQSLHEGSNAGSQHVFYRQIWKIISKLNLLSPMSGVWIVVSVYI